MNLYLVNEMGVEPISILLVHILSWKKDSNRDVAGTKKLEVENKL